MNKQMTKDEADTILKAVENQIEQVDGKFHEFVNKVAELTKEYGFSGFLLSVGFVPKLDNAPPLYLALAAHRDTPGPDHLAALMQSSVDKADQSLHDFGDVAAPEPIAFKPRHGYA